MATEGYQIGKFDKVSEKCVAWRQKPNQRKKENTLVFRFKAKLAFDRKQFTNLTVAQTQSIRYTGSTTDQKFQTRPLQTKRMCL